MVLYLIGILVALAFAAMLWQQRKNNNNWQRQFTFFVDLLALSATALVVGVLAMVQLATPVNPDSAGSPIVSAPADATVEPLPDIEPEPEPTIENSDVGEEEPTPTTTETVEASEPTITATPIVSATEAITATLEPTATIEISSTVEATAEVTPTVASTEEATPTVAATSRAGTPTRTPRPSATPRPSSTPRATATPQATATLEPTATPENQTYQVQAGDTLSEIAAQFGVTTAAIIAANPGINADSLQIGDVLVIPSPGATPPPVQATATSATTTYAIQAGDSFGSIAAEFGTTIAELQRLNPGVDSNRLQIGQVIVVPR